MMHIHSPCEAYDPIIDVHEAEVGCWYADVQGVNDELVARIRTHSARRSTQEHRTKDNCTPFESKLSCFALCHIAEIFLTPGFGGTQLLSLLGKPTGLQLSVEWKIDMHRKTFLTLSRLCVMLNKIPASQNRFEVEAILRLSEGLRVMIFTAFACKMHTSK